MVKIYEAIVKLLIPTNSDEVYKHIVSQAALLIDAHEGSIFIEKNDSLVRVYSTVAPKDQLEPREDGNVIKVFETGKPRYLSSQYLKKIHPEIKSDVKSVTIIPLSFHKKRLGVLTMQSNTISEMTQNHKDRLKVFGAVASLAIRNAQLYEQKQKALETRDLFLSVASHELKTPLTSIKGYAQLIHKSKSPKKDWSEAIVRNSNRLNSMMQDLLSISQISAGSFKLTKKEINFTKLVLDCLKDFQIASKRRINQNIPEQPTIICGDSGKLYSVVSNILRNAAKYSTIDSPIFLSLSSNKKQVTLTVTDKGSGISAKDQKQIFKKYFRGKNKKSGLGLGLYIGKRIVQGHGGEIAISSKLAKGTKVIVELPLT